MKLDQLPQKWRDRLAELVRSKHGKDHDSPQFEDRSLRLTFEDRSAAFFKFAFYLTDPQTNELAVFTEHCGYHLFPFWGTEIETFCSEWIEIGSQGNQ